MIGQQGCLQSVCLRYLVSYTVEARGRAHSWLLWAMAKWSVSDSGGGFFSQVDLSLPMFYFEWLVYLYWYGVYDSNSNTREESTLGIHTVNFRCGVPGWKTSGFSLCLGAPYLVCYSAIITTRSSNFHSHHRHLRLSDVILTMTSSNSTSTVSWEIKPDIYNIMQTREYL